MTKYRSLDTVTLNSLQDHVELETYCDDRDIVKIAPLYNPSAGGILTFSSNLAKASPLSSLYTEQFEISPNEAEQVVKDVQKNQFRFKHLADNIEIIFRVPVNFKSLISSSNNAPKKPPSILQYEEPKPSANIVPISSYPTNLPVTLWTNYLLIGYYINNPYF